MDSSAMKDEVEAVAIIGMAGRFPGAEDVVQFWRNLRDGVESVSFFADDEVESSPFNRAKPDDPNYVKAAGVLKQVEMFDAGFFGFTPREAEITDPQHRVFLECAWEALESSGYDAENFKGRVGVYAGSGLNSYWLRLYSKHGLLESLDPLQVVIGNEKDHLSTRTSYKLNLRGPSVNVQTTCSSSLVAVSLAYQSLLNYECDIALAGAVSIRVPQKQGYYYHEGGILSPDGHCRAFDAEANGTVGGSGVGIVVLRRLTEARAEGDHIRAIIKGAAVNNDGAAKVGYTAPGVEGQAGVIAEALAVAGLTPDAISYVEAHGTATPLGDPVEVAALSKVFRAAGGRGKSCAIGSVKTNIGHLDTAAGVAGLIKTVLALEHGQLPPSLHFKRPNPKIDLDDSPFYVNSELSAWESGGAPRRAGVSSFGIGGTNAHVVLEEPPPQPQTGGGRAHQLILLSAKTLPALDAATARLAAHLKEQPQANLADVAYTLQVGRRRFAERRALVCSGIGEAVDALDALDARRILTASEERRNRPVAFVLAGQGAQYVNMAREIYASEKSFRERVDGCAEILTPLLGTDVREHIFPEAGSAGEVSGRLDQTGITQPALFTIEYALACLWMDWGVRPRAMIGHSIGEYVAACLAGVFSPEDALAVVAARARLMQSLPTGAMLAVPLAEREVSAMLGDGLSLAAVNAPRLCVVSGAQGAVEELSGRLAGEGVECRLLRTSHAFHSSAVESIEAAFAEQVRKVKLRPPQIPYISNLTGTWIEDAEATSPTYWVRHLRRTVRFADGLKELLRDEELALLEVGPGGMLGALLGQYGEAGERRVALSSLRSRHQADTSDMAHLLATLGKLWLAGVRIDWANFHEVARRRVPLPTYPFERRRYWMDAQPDENGATEPDEKPDISRWFYAPVWKQDPNAELSALSTNEPSGRWLIFLDDCGLGERAADQLRRDGREVSTVRRGTRFEQISAGEFIIDPARRGDYETLFAELSTGVKEPSAILHLWGVTAPQRAAGDVAATAGGESARAGAAGFYELMFLAQALGNVWSHAAVSLAVVTNGTQKVTGEERLEPAKATALGAARVIPLEYDNVTCRCIDVSLPTESDAHERLAARLIAEAGAPADESIVAYRGDMRWTQVFEPLRMATPEAQSPPPTRERGTYLFTNGVGEFELAFAEHLARGAGARLVLVADETFPVRDEWGKWQASHVADEEISRRISQLEALEARGAEVLFIGADVTDAEQMRGVVAQARERFGRLDGVFHSSPATGGGGLLQLKTTQAAERVIAPRVGGALVLDEVLKDEPPDFVVFFSATSAITGALGQADYCAANSFLDAYARARCSRNATRVMSVSWGLQRQEDWQESALAGGRLQAQFRLRNERYGMTTAEKVGALERLLAVSLPHVIVSTENFPALVREQRALTAASFLQDLAHAEGDEGTHHRPELKSSYAAPRNEVEQAVCAVWQEVFGVSRVGVEDNFFDLGGNSLIGIQLMSRLRKTFEIELPMNHLFESPTVAGLAHVIAAQRLRQSELEEVERTLRLIEQLSLDEVQARLAEDKQTGDGEAS